MKQLRDHLERKKHIAKKHIDPKLLLRLVIFSIIILIIAVIGGYRYSRGDITLFHLSIGISLGATIGYIAGRMFRIFWHEELERVMSQLDKTGAIFLVLYIGVELGRDWLFGHWLHGVELSAFGIVFLGGFLLGRFLSMISAIRRILVEKEKV